MARQCEVCGKKPGYGHSLSHSHVKTLRRFLPNLQRVRVLIDGRPQRINVCTTCLKSGRVRRVVHEFPANRRKVQATVPSGLGKV